MALSFVLNLFCSLYAFNSLEELKFNAEVEARDELEKLR